MKNLFNITEEDLFNFAINPELLPKDKRNYIESNSTLFSAEIEYFHQLFLNFNNCETKVLETKVESDLINKKIISLFPNKLPITKSQLNLVAASVVLTKHFDFFSFTDEDNQFLIRINRTDEKSKLYVFAKEQIKTNLVVKLFPSGRSYLLANGENETEIENEKMIDQITVEKTK